MDLPATRVTAQGTQGALWRDAALCAGLLLGLSVASLMLGTVALGPERVLAALLSPASDPTAAAIVRNLRLLRWCLGSLEQRDWTSWQQAWHAALVALVLALASLACPHRKALRWAGAVLAATAATLAAGAVGLVGLLAGGWAARASDRAGAQLALAGLAGATLLLGLDLAARGLTALLPSLGLVGELPVGALVVVISLPVAALRWQRGRRAASGAS